MASIFRKDDKHVNKPNRNVYPKSFDSNITTKFGQIIPAFCKPVMNGETIEISPTMSFNFLPLVFPIQNRVRANLEFYYVRHRNLWKDWEDFQFKMKDGLVPPYHVFRKDTYQDMLKVGGLLDNLGVDVVLRGNYNVNLATPKSAKTSLHKSYDAITDTFMDIDGYQALTDYNAWPITTNGDRYEYWEYAVTETSEKTASTNICIFRKPITVNNEGNEIRFKWKKQPLGDAYVYLLMDVYEDEIVTIDRSTSSSSKSNVERGSSSSTSSRNNLSTAGSRVGSNVIGGRSSDEASIVHDTAIRQSSQYSTEYGVKTIVYQIKSEDLVVGATSVVRFNKNVKCIRGLIYKVNEGCPEFELEVNVQTQFGAVGVPLAELALTSLPFPYINENGALVDDERYLHLISTPARAIKSIYNARIRNAANNPFMINGVPEYNKFIDNDNGGPDSDYYPLYYRNWQDDSFTTALHSPQHGEAPLVGLVNQNPENGWRVTFANDDGTKTRVHFGPRTQEGVVKIYSDDPQQDGTSDGYVGQLQEAMMEAVKFGITINDFRNVNSFQRWLENNVRKGYKYRDQIKSHWGVSVEYDVLDMPEYIGGMSRDMNVQQVTQTTENQYGNLGDFSGQAWITGDMKSKITHHCDEDGFIIGLLSVQPIASYSQPIPKYLLRESAFDWYSPEFGKIGMQPILKREIAPLQSFYENNGTEVFGYQRAWYDLLDSINEVHGKFRTDFRNFVINRTFDAVPELGEDFLVMSDDDINNVFYVDDGEDKILGQIHFDYASIIPVPQYGVAALE